MKKSAKNLMVIENFILHATHCSEGDSNANSPIPILANQPELTANKLYEMARDYIAEDHVDGVDADTDTLKLVHDKDNARVILEDDVDVAFYTDKFNNEDHVVEKVIQMYNDGKLLNDIREYIKQEANCSPSTKIEIISGLSLIVGKYK
jgi:hypothetical protein